ncbi:protein SSUH2 [Trichonephila clavipes]|uniref:Protein SSUH2 n=1 Tax=Trichonephila clavipes TaxID=2585209 RepID=A0A8X6UU67_TRICX|nr:protein SSUH2 [Trichonephila clavipes]
MNSTSHHDVSNATTSYCPSNCSKLCGRVGHSTADTDRRRIVGTPSNRSGVFAMPGEATSHDLDTPECGSLNEEFKDYLSQVVVQLKKRHKLDHISNASQLPTDVIRKVSGKELFKEQGETVQPINFPINSALNEASTRLITSLSTPVDARVLMQRHSLVAIPYTRATYIWRRKKGQFYVYGYQQEVYFQEYPQQCCCCTCC